NSLHHTSAPSSPPISPVRGWLLRNTMRSADSSHMPSSHRPMHGALQPPQCAGSLSRLTHAPSQAVSGGLQPGSPSPSPGSPSPSPGSPSPGSPSPGSPSPGSPSPGSPSPGSPSPGSPSPGSPSPGSPSPGSPSPTPSVSLSELNAGFDITQ